MAVPSGSSLVTRSLRIFVVEDHTETCKYLCEYLEMLGHQVACALNLADALEKLPHAGCDVLLRDIVLPDGSGWELLPLVNKQLPLPTYAVAMSGHVLADHQDRSEQAGSHHHLHKPINLALLNSVLEEAAEVQAHLSRDSAAPPAD